MSRSPVSVSVSLLMKIIIFFQHLKKKHLIVSIVASWNDNAMKVYVQVSLYVSLLIRPTTVQPTCLNPQIELSHELGKYKMDSGFNNNSFEKPCQRLAGPQLLTWSQI